MSKVRAFARKIPKWLLLAIPLVLACLAWAFIQVRNAKRKEEIALELGRINRSYEKRIEVARLANAELAKKVEETHKVEVAKLEKEQEDIIKAAAQGPVGLANAWNASFKKKVTK